MIQIRNLGWPPLARISFFVLIICHSLHYGYGSTSSSSSPELKKGHTHYVKNSEELHTALKDAKDGAVIFLQGGDYLGHFTLNQSGVTLMGDGGKSGKGKSILRPFNRTALTIWGGNSFIVNLKVLGADSIPQDNGARINGLEIYSVGNTISNVTVDGGWGSECLRGVYIYNGKNTVSNIDVKNCSYGVIMFHSDGNKVVNSRFEDISDEGLRLNGDRNVVENVTVKHTRYGLRAMGDYNLVTNFHFDTGNNLGFGMGVYVEYVGAVINGRGNRINNITCAGLNGRRVDTNEGLITMTEEPAVYTRCKSVYQMGNAGLRNIPSLVYFYAGVLLVAIVFYRDNWNNMP